MSKIGACPCVFKDERCRYAGAETWCDKTFERCRVLGNVINFRGGYPQPIPPTHPVDILKDLGVELTPEQEARGRAACDGIVWKTGGES